MYPLEAHFSTDKHNYISAALGLNCITSYNVMEANWQANNCLKR